MYTLEQGPNGVHVPMPPNERKKLREYLSQHKDVTSVNVRPEEIEKLAESLTQEGVTQEEVEDAIKDMLQTEILRKEKVFEPPTLANAKAYQAAYDYYNEHLFKKVFGEPLPHAMLNFSRSGRSHAAAFFSPEQWKDVKSGAVIPEISIVPATTSMPIQEVMRTLCHEMCHFKDQLDGKPGKNGYHARSWFKWMAEIGLPGVPHNNSKTKVSERIEPGGPFEIAFNSMPKDLIMPFAGRPQNRKAKNPNSLQGVRIKYECPSCGIHVRGKSGLQIRCDTCDEVLYDCGA